ncbi:NAD(P)/FAD-dependent oxidoreductase [Cocleimonas sp. KMM 6892]|uniref:NAD(P)/FAD-dependent oxidoreductase n=1 Tax=unclassified Cocleimonas TaxID=2639732 RepID=UPI002DBA8297|nr:MULTISPECIES: NAD(P)/FAD-dependent oxidoreductase [unclassified Cocleimonas]MEB8432438.1 NAD(P)/FAD-dependent oxidoreductase [Cocleimonas sp. KMM 6892]MEC4715297.1 NAD(P)/FAD-dependent oxidoreductase [Cocleimonas sp. KMM 6895]MEC4745084.1 NAD(P)/FAD-dependent oxidoreductase [Cocleimonas sp. KMM 6896]
MSNTQNHDVVIAGGGLAGLTLSMQLKQQSPDLDVAVLEQRTFPVPETIAKVGESTVEIGSHYFSEVLGLKDHFEKDHLRKYGLRCFFGEQQSDFSDQDELGISDLFGIPTYQIDRGVLENKLHREASKLGVNIIDGISTSNIRLDKHHQQIDIANNGDIKTLNSKWFVDAAGRQMLVKKELNLAKENDHKANAVWFRIDRQVTLDDWTSNSDWQNRLVESGKRWLSTNHLMGPGYWVWVIPLGTGTTSIGIVMDDQVFEESDFNDYDDAFAWLAKNQPHCANAIEGAEVLDYVAIRDYSYDCKKYFSEDGWGLTGEAGVFADPFYSPGSDAIAMSNTFISSLISTQKEKNNISLESVVFNSLQNNYYENTLSLYTQQYGGFGDRRMMGTKLLWDYSYYWGILSLLFFKNTFVDIDTIRELNPLLAKAKMLHQQVQEKLRERASKRIIQPAQGIFLDQYLIPCLRHFNDVLKDYETVDIREAVATNTEMLERIAKYSLEFLSDNPSQSISDDERELLGDYRHSVLA